MAAGMKDGKLIPNEAERLAIEAFRRARQRLHESHKDIRILIDLSNDLEQWSAFDDALKVAKREAHDAASEYVSAAKALGLQPEAPAPFRPLAIPATTTPRQP